MLADRFVLFLGVVLSAILAIWISPENLSSLGLMDRSLASPLPIVRETALLEIRVARISLVVSCLLLAGSWLILPRLVASEWYSRVQNVGFPPTYEIHQRRIFTPTAFAAFAVLALAALYLVFGGVVFSKTALAYINREDGILETVSALLLIVAAGSALRVGIAVGWSAVGVAHVFLAVLFFMMCGEEISWGQRFLNIEAPEALRGLNVQNEINLHNMFGYFFDHLFILGFFVWGCVVPTLYWRSGMWRWLLTRMGLPFPSIGLAVAMLAVTLTQEQLTVFIGTVPGLRVPELREFLSAFCFLLMMLESRHLVIWSQHTAEGNENLSVE